MISSNSSKASATPLPSYLLPYSHVRSHSRVPPPFPFCLRPGAREVSFVLRKHCKKPLRRPHDLRLGLTLILEDAGTTVLLKGSVFPRLSLKSLHFYLNLWRFHLFPCLSSPSSTSRKSLVGHMMPSHSSSQRMMITRSAHNKRGEDRSTTD